MGVDLHQTIERMKASGVRLMLDAGALRIESKALLTHQQRQWIKANERALIEALHQEHKQWLDDFDEAAERFHERAAIIEFDGGLSRAKAEAEARKHLRDGD